MKFAVYLLSSAIFFSNSVCALDHNFPRSKEERRNDEMGSIIGGEGLVIRPGKIFNRSPDTKPAKHVLVEDTDNYKNQNLWRAALEEIEYLPLVSINSEEGIIISDWYRLTDKPSYGYKVKIQVLNQANIENSLKLVVYERNLVKGEWVNSPVNSDLTFASHLKDKILSKAKKMSVKSK